MQRKLTSYAKLQIEEKGELSNFKKKKKPQNFSM